MYILEDQNVSITGGGSFEVDDIINDVTATPTGTWPAGFYRMRILSGEKVISYTNHYLDVSYNYYNDVNRLISSVSPNGFVQLTNTVPFVDTDHTSYLYNHQGWLLSMTEPDAGATAYAYRKDGSIRFSQNAEQAVTGKYSYTNYDLSGRPVESGEYIPPAGVYFEDVKNNTSVLEAALDSWMQGTVSVTRKDWVKTHYDFVYPDLQSILPDKYQDFVMGAVSWTENENIITWYSYDDLGRVQWMAQQPQGMGDMIFLTEYTYDFLGNVLTVANKSRLSGSVNDLNQFYHYYTYDADKRLNTVQTSPDGVNLKLQATYSYYLHGPLKRIELADHLQGIDFVYNINGWLKSINDPSADPGKDGQVGEANQNFRKDVFGMVLDYYESSMNVFSTSGILELQDPMQYHHIPQLESKENRLISQTLTPSLFKDELWKNLKYLNNKSDLKLGGGE